MRRSFYQYVFIRDAGKYKVGIILEMDDVTLLPVSVVKARMYWQQAGTEYPLFW